MKFFVIPPVKSLHLAELGTAGLYCLAHLYLKDENYRSFFKEHSNKGTFILLDNSAAEKELIEEDVLVEIIKELKPNLVVAPDHLFDAKKTLDAFQSFCDRIDRDDLLKDGYIKDGVFACPQGDDIYSWTKCYEYMMDHPYVVRLGLSKISVPKVFLGESRPDVGIKEGRHACVDFLLKHDLIRTPIHCLGMGDPREYEYYKNIPQIVSTDSCYTVLAGYNGIVFEEGDFQRVPTPHEYFDYVLTKEQEENSIKNIEWMKNNL